jgi:hypothetical protein
MNLRPHRILLFLLIMIQHLDLTASEGMINVSPRIGDHSFSVPVSFEIQNGPFTINHQFVLSDKAFPSERYWVNSYHRENISLISEFSTIAWTSDISKLNIGRNYISSGPRAYNSGLFSAFSPSLDHVAFELSLGRHLTYEYQLIRLDDRQSDIGAYKRWIYYRRLETHLGERIKFGLKDFVLATGVQRGVDLAYLNPAAIFQLEQLHGNTEAGTAGQNNDNQIMGFDVEYTTRAGSRIYFDFILDEFQIDAKDRKHVQDVFGLTLGTELKRGKNTSFIEYWLASPWLYTNGGEYTNIETNGFSIGYLSPNAYGVTLGYSMEHSKYQPTVLVNVYKQGDQSVNTVWDSVDNRIPIGLSDQNWQSAFDLRLGIKNNRYIKELRATYDLLNSEGFHLILTFQALDWHWSD